MTSAGDLLPIAVQAVNRGADLVRTRLPEVLTVGEVLRVRMFGSAAVDLAWVANGSTGGTVILDNNPWDTAAGAVIAREAGARVVDIDGTEHTSRSRATIAAAPSIVGELLALIQKAIET